MTKREGTVYIYIIETESSSEQKVLMEARRRAACILLEHFQDAGISFKRIAAPLIDLVKDGDHDVATVFEYRSTDDSGLFDVLYSGNKRIDYIKKYVEKKKEQYEHVKVIDLNAIVADWGDEPAVLGYTPDRYRRMFQQETEHYLGSEKFKRWKNAVH